SRRERLSWEPHRSPPEPPQQLEPEPGETPRTSPPPGVSWEPRRSPPAPSCPCSSSNMEPCRPPGFRVLKLCSSRAPYSGSRRLPLRGGPPLPAFPRGERDLLPDAGGAHGDRAHAPQLRDLLPAVE